MRTALRILTRSHWSTGFALRDRVAPASPPTLCLLPVPGDKRHWRKADILVDTIQLMLAEDPKAFSGHQLIDETYLRSRGVQDFALYRCDPDHEPPPLSDLGKSLHAARASDWKKG